METSCIYVIKYFSINFSSQDVSQIPHFILLNLSTCKLPWNCFLYSGRRHEYTDKKNDVIIDGTGVNMNIVTFAQINVIMLSGFLALLRDTELGKCNPFLIL